MDIFKEGMIVRVFCENFLTYNSIECYPSAKLNMIIGPNGTGKSSLVNAIVLGLGGKITVIGRAKQLSAYVKRGCTNTKIEIELFSEPVNYTICRKFNIENKSTWSINGETVVSKQVESIIKNLNIQVDNLCQFLPQDRVQDFAKMDSKQLLENTLKTVGSNEIVNLHTSLKELREKETNLESQTKSIKEQLKSEKTKITRLETEVKAIQEREVTLNNVKIIKKKKGWVECELKEKLEKEVVKDKKNIEDMTTAAERNLIPFHTSIKDVKNQIRMINKDIEKQINTCGEKSTALRRKLNVTSNVDDHIQTLKNELQRKLEAQDKRAANISKLEKEIELLAAVVDPEKESRLATRITEMQAVLYKKTTEVTRIQSEAKEAEDNLADVTRVKLRLEAAVEREMSSTNQKIQVLAQRFRDTSRAYEWLQQNKDQFQCAIYGPILLEINCGEAAAKYVEFTIPQRDLIAFVCEDKDDMNNFMKVVRDGMGLRINIVQATQNFRNLIANTYKPDIPIQGLKQFGFWSYMIDQVEGPNPVLDYLCANYGLHKIPLGNSQTNSLIDSIPPSIATYFSDSHHYSVRVSKYSGEKSSRIVSVRPSTLLIGSSNASLIKEYQINIQKEHRKLEKFKQDLDNIKSRIMRAERERDDLRNEKKTVDQQLMSMRSGKTRLAIRKEELDVLLKEGDLDTQALEERTKMKILKSVAEVCAAQKNAVEHFRDYQKSVSRNSLNKIKLSKSQEILKRKEQESMEATKQFEDCKRMLSNVEENLRRAKRDFKMAHEEALKLTDGLSPKDPDFKKKYNEQFSKLPDDLDALDMEISNLSARADCLAGGRMSVLEEYEKTKSLIQRLTAAVANPELQLQALKTEMEEMRGKWLPQVLKLIQLINDKFSNFFCLMKCVGEVSLETPEDQDEYSKYGICIKVKFRETGQLQQLGPHTQSGGERAVSTAIYMLSLQELTTVPFRCVDEINQGMDEFNERMVFKLMVKTVEQENSAQCFLLTPKVLHSLDYSEHVKVHCIYSGVGSTSHHEFNVSKYLKRVRRESNRLKRESLKRNHSDSDAGSD